MPPGMRPLPAAQPVAGGSPANCGYVNFMDHDERAGDQAAHGGTLRRLQRIKAACDPQNVFRLNQNVTPRAAA